MKKLIIIAVAAVLVFSGALTGVVAFLNTPERVAARALNGMFEDLGEREEFEPLVEVLKNGSIAFELDSKTLNEQIGEDLSVEGKFYFNEKAVMLDDLSVKLGEVKLSGGLYFDMDRFYVKNSEILDGVWGLERGKLEEEWKDSIFAPKSDSDVALDEDTFNIIGELLSFVDKETDKEMAKDMEKVLDRYAEKIWDLFCENAEFESENDSVRINKERKNARVITITLDGDAVATIVESLIEYLLADDELKDLVVKYGDMFAELLETYADIEDIDDAYDELMEDLEESADDLVEELEDAVDEEIVITLVTPTMSSKLLMLTVEYDDSELVSVQFGHEGLAKTNTISLMVADALEIEYNVTENSKEEFKASLSAMGEEIITFEMDKDKGEYELVLVDLFQIEGTMVTKGKVHTVTVDSLSVFETSYYDDTTSVGEVYEKLGITLIFNEKDKMPEPEEKIKSLLTLDEEEVLKWSDRLEELGLLDLVDYDDEDYDDYFDDDYDDYYDDDYDDYYDDDNYYDSYNGYLYDAYTCSEDGTEITYDFYGESVVMTVEILGNVVMEINGFYEIEDGWITFEFSDEDASPYNGTFPIEVGDYSIIISEVEYVME